MVRDRPESETGSLDKIFLDYSFCYTFHRVWNFIVKIKVAFRREILSFLTPSNV